MQVRFDREGGEVVTRRLELGEAVDSPWPGLRFAVLRRFERARLEQTVKAPEVIRRERRPAVLLELTAGQDSGELWVQKYGRQEVSLGDQEYEVSYGNKAHALGFALTLNHFRIGYYPGEERPRSYESHIDLADAMTGRTQSRVISMNHPVKHGGYSFYQSSYRQDGGRAVSFLSVSRDPGKPVVFAGYVGVMVGMVMVLGTRIGERRRKSRAAVSTAGSPVVVGAETA